MPSIAQPTDTDFEITFGDLAHAQLRDKAPSLLDYLLGFQVIDQNEDQTHGIGVMGFEVGEQILFVPSFFLNGELKQNLIYLKNQDLFVPLQDNWVQYLLNRRPASLGEPERLKEQELGIQQPDLAPLTNNRTGGSFTSHGFGAKYSSDAREYLDKSGAAMMFTLVKDKYAGLPSLPDFLRKTASVGTSRALAAALRHDVKFANAVLKHYPLDELLHHPDKKEACASYASSAMSNKKKKRAYRRMPRSIKSAGILFDIDEFLEKNGSHRVNVISPSDAQDRFLLDDDLGALARGEIVVKDARDNTNVAYESTVNTSLQNPTECGHHRMLLSNGKYRDVCIGIGPKAIGGGHVKIAIVVDKETGDYGYWWPEHIWVEPKTDLHEKDGDYFDDLTDMSSMKVGKTYAAISKTRQMSIAFTVRRKDTGKDGSIELHVEPHISDPGSKPTGTRPFDNVDLAQFGEGSHLPFVGDITPEEDEDNGNDSSSSTPFSQLRQIVITDDDREMRIIRRTLFVPKTAKAMPLKDGNSLESWGLSDPSSLADMEMNILKSGEVEELNLLKKAEGVYVGDAGPYNRVQLLSFLTKDAGLSGPQSKNIAAALPVGKRERFIVKNNIGFGQGFPEPDMGYDPYSGVQEQYPQEDQLPVEMPYSDPSVYTGKLERSQMMDAAQQGQKDIFDTSAIAALVRTADSQDLITQYLSDIILGLDRTNRILFMFYWLNEQFRDRYGQENLVELEDQLKNVSKSQGDLVLFLKQRQVEGSPSFDAMEIDLGVK